MKPRILTIAVAAASVIGSTPVLAESSLSANIGAVSNYMWRGVTQTDDGAAIQGGVDFAHESGFYLGTWVSNVDFGTPDPNYELDLYGGYGGEVGEFGYDISTIYYAYPDGNDSNFWELGLSGSWRMVTVGLQYTLDGEADSPAPFTDGDLYYYGSLDFELPMDFGIGATLGYYDFDDFGDEADYTHWALSLSKSAGDFGTFSLNYEQNDGGDDEIVAADDDAKFWVGWLKEF
jgi:uncharacterized protein (TIGR02001 family)